jgi:ATP-dependent DNA helicase DinG
VSNSKRFSARPGRSPRKSPSTARVAEAIRDNAVLLCEAGTGTGKTFAYLVPALLSAGKVIISTGTKTLQDQLYRRDLPTVRAALGVAATTALLKGRANYVCHYHLERNLEARQHGRDIETYPHRGQERARAGARGRPSLGSRNLNP